MNKKLVQTAEIPYGEFIALDKLFQAWSEFKKGKRGRIDVQVFERNLEDNILSLHENLRDRTYQHSTYQAFYVNDPKQRHIHKASVTDRVVHHLLYTYLYNLFDPTFIYDSYSCRENKGTHKGVERLKAFTRKVSKNYTRNCWALKLDIKKFFASIDHKILSELLNKRIKDEDILYLLSTVINSFYSEYGEGKGIPLGNLTSQVFANIYMNELDQFIKHTLQIKHYLRYADDFLFVSDNRKELEALIEPVQRFLLDRLKLELHPHKISFRKLAWGIDFLGYILLPHYILSRTKTKKRIFKQINSKLDLPNFNESLQSYLGYFSHANSYKLTQKLKNHIWFWQNT